LKVIQGEFVLYTRITAGAWGINCNFHRSVSLSRRHLNMYDEAICYEFMAHLF